MAAHAVDADQHQRADGVAHGLDRLARGDFDADFLGLVGDLALDVALGAASKPPPSAVIRSLSTGSGQSVRRQDGPPASATTCSLRSFRSVKKARQSALTDAGVLLEPGVQILDISRVGAVEKRGLRE